MATVQTEEDVRTAIVPTRQVILTICSPKGGAGKTTISRALLVAAANDSWSVLGIDFDPQQGLAKWSARRDKARAAQPAENWAAAHVRTAGLQNWREEIVRVHGADLVVIDTPPSVEANLPAIHGLCSAASMVVVPTAATRDDLDSVMPWMTLLVDAGLRASFVMNRVNRRTITFTKSQARLLRTGPVCPVEIPAFDDIHSLGDNGLTVLDVARSKGREPLESLWAYIHREATRA